MRKNNFGTNFYDDEDENKKDISNENSTINFLRNDNVNPNMIKNFINSEKISNYQKENSNKNHKFKDKDKEILTINNNPLLLDNSMTKQINKANSNIDDSLFNIPHTNYNNKFLRQEENPSIAEDSFNKLDGSNFKSNNQKNESIINKSEIFEQNDFNIEIVYKFNEKLKYPKNYGLWYIYHQRANSSFGPLSSKEVESLYKQGKINIQTKIRLIDIFNFFDKEPFSFIQLNNLETALDCIMPNLLLRFLQNLKLDTGLKSYIQFEENEKEISEGNDLKVEANNANDRIWEDNLGIPIKEENSKNKNKKKKIKRMDYQKKSAENNDLTLIKNNETSVFATESFMNVLDNRVVTNNLVKEEIVEKILEDVDEEEWQEVKRKKKIKEIKNKTVGLKDKHNKNEKEVNVVNNIEKKKDLYEILKKKADLKQNNLEEMNKFHNFELNNFQKKNIKPKPVDLNVRISLFIF